MKPNFLQFAEKAQESIDREYKVLSSATDELQKSRAEVERKAQQLLDKEVQLNQREKSQDAREEEIVRKESLIRDTEQSRIDRENAVREREAAEKALIKAQTIEAEVKQKEDELFKRELALSEEKKSYMDALKKEFVDSVIGRVI